MSGSAESIFIMDYLTVLLIQNFQMVLFFARVYFNVLIRYVTSGGVHSFISSGL